MCFLRYTNSNIPPHTDCTYFEEAPGLQIFHCISGSYSGGLTSLIDGFAVASRMSAQHADAYAVLCNVRIPFRYIGDGYHLSNRCHVFTLDDAGHVVQFRYNNCDRAPLDAATLALHPQAGAPPVAGRVTYEHVYDALQKLHRVMDDPSMKVQFKLAPGKVPLPCAFLLRVPASLLLLPGNRHQQPARPSRALRVHWQPPPLRSVRATGGVDGPREAPSRCRPSPSINSLFTSLLLYALPCRPRLLIADAGGCRFYCIIILA